MLRAGGTGRTDRILLVLVEILDGLVDVRQAEQRADLAGLEQRIIRRARNVDGHAMGQPRIRECTDDGLGEDEDALLSAKGVVLNYTLFVLAEFLDGIADAPWVSPREGTDDVHVSLQI